MTLFDIMTYSACLSALIGISLFLRIRNRQIRALIIFHAVSCICDLLLIYIIPMGDGWHVRLFYCFLRPAEYLVYAYLLLGFDKQTFPGVYALLSSSIVIIFSIYQLTFRLQQYDLTDQLMLIEGVLIVVMSLIYFRSMLLADISQDPITANLWINARFWIATSLLFFFAGNIMVTGFYHKLYNHSESFTKLLYSYTNLVLGIAQSVMFAIAYTAASRSQAE